MTRNLLLLAAVLLPAACSHAPTMEEMAASCTASGYASGTEGGLLCLQMAVSRQQVAEADRRARMQVLGAQLGEMGRRISAGPQAYAQPRAPATTCFPMGNGGFTCN